MVIALGLVGCIQGIPYKFIHQPVLAANVPKIIKGQTTREQILKFFGPPDIEADGAQSKVNSNMPLIMMYRESGFKNELPSGLRLERFFPYSSIDEEHIAFFYLEHCYKYKLQTFVPVANVIANTVDQFFNKLLILINKNAGVVDEFSFREEFKAPCRDIDRTLSRSPTSAVCQFSTVHIGPLPEQCAPP